MQRQELVDGVEAQWGQWLESAEEQRVAHDFPAAFMERHKQVLEASEYVAQCCQRDPQLLVSLFQDGDLVSSFGGGEMAARLNKELEEVAEEAGLHKVLRLFRRRQMVRIIWRDTSGSAPLSETLEDLSALADACIQGALDHLYEWAVTKQGVPRDAEGNQQYLVVLGMGKLGARELNLSSDIDLIYTYPSVGEVDGPRYLSNEQFFTRLCQQLTKAINTHTVDGFVFRVDARLRPFGNSGPLAFSFDAMEVYYQSQAREWERYAMVKARVVAGDPEAGAHLMAMLKPFVYRRYLDFGAIESIRDMKQMISRELQRKGMADNVKLGPGGIREIEFIGQAFQLIRGGRDPELQIRPILPVLQLLSEKQLLPEYVVSDLTHAYEFLRLVENRIQAWQDKQTHLLPEDDAGRLRMARSMGFEGWHDFHNALEHHRSRVQGHFDKVFAVPQTEDEREERPLQSLWCEELDEAQASEALEAAGFRDSALAVEKLGAFRDSHAFRGIGTRGRERLDQLMPLLLEAVGASAAPEVTLERVLKLLEAVGRRAAYLALLVESPIALSQLVRLTSISPWISQQLSRHPLLFDEMLDPRRLYSPLHREGLEEELDTLLAPLDADDLEQQMERLRQFSQSNMLRVAAADLTGVIPLMVVSDYLTEIAEAVTARVLKLVWDGMAGRYGKPQEIDSSDTGFLVLGYGKMGGIELGYGSDLDLVFVHGNRNPNAMTDGERPVANDVFYVRMGQRMIHMFTTRTPSGLLYEVDMRLRPNGNSGMLVTPIEAFELYQKNDAWTWEHQALLRARPVAGDPVLMEQFKSIRREVLSRQRDPDELHDAVRDMREKMRASLDKSGNGQFDIKQGRGGIADIEFMVQYSVLRWANQYPDLLDWTDNIRLLDTLARHDLLEGNTTEVLANNYRVFRAAYHRNALSELPGLIGDEKLAEERKTVRELWESLMEA
ncbi:bifunctional [glutamate--ammonia ligase]-adenylyl-L-tyrosine phosphorylase/[glutamate--ammonia-ligase] adenylyltransferase [Solemya velesiana gill symbiont]|uniref:Bifunctional glutamine synthetase adenylyltransferase/adenylyl-removing enzyme n=1 Tax=Solemya velesiana gill symbiont TaxID=1918948 RepID=A0A1T2KWL1_9GAMM|nr:bifunctional [glutamate--ammonia ligase]-adenylyl-L-tyrosine phosphorylase/[glutamate--ammonia-ligase] adenylyltransferase [Solemya velesiana gill symbiont]OOZ37140.1 bifunctional glutamine synthetase adenylyltransferase/deadenyltransferase [Solemya velesiana gill symbiont]